MYITEIKIFELLRISSVLISSHGIPCSHPGSLVTGLCDSLVLMVWTISGAGETEKAVKAMVWAVDSAGNSSIQTNVCRGKWNTALRISVKHHI